MAYNELLAERVRKYLLNVSAAHTIIEKKMFGGLAFMVDGKMCVNVSGENLMCRFDPVKEKNVSNKKGYLPMIMKGKKYKGYCYIEESGFKSHSDFEYWIKLCLDFNDKAKPSK